jgi:hypothetical protein
MLRQKGCSSVPILFPSDSIIKRTRPVFPPRQTRLSTGWNSPTSQTDSTASGRHQPIYPLTVIPSRDRPRRRLRCVSPTIARCCNPSTVAGVYPLSPALLRAHPVKRGVDICPDILGVGTQYSLRGFGRDIKTNPIDQEVSLPSTDAPESIFHCSAEVPVLPCRLLEPITSDCGASLQADVRRREV